MATIPKAMAATRNALGMSSAGVQDGPLFVRVREGRSDQRNEDSGHGYQRKCMHEFTQPLGQPVDDHAQAQVLVAVNGNGRADHRGPYELHRHHLVHPDDRPAKHVARDNAYEQKHGDGRDERGRCCLERPHPPGSRGGGSSSAALGVSVTMGSAVGFIAETGVARSMKSAPSRQPSLPVYFSRVAQASFPNLPFHSA